MERPVIARPRRASPVLICKKCLKRSTDGGKLRRALKRELKLRPHGTPKPSKIVTTGCFGICPKKAVVLASGNSLQNGEYLLVSSLSQIEDALASLQLDE
jgi:hypothetical protein